MDPKRQRAAQEKRQGERKDPYYDDQDHTEHSQQSSRRIRRRSLLARAEPRVKAPPRKPMTLSEQIGTCLANTKENYKVRTSLHSDFG